MLTFAQTSHKRSIIKQSNSIDDIIANYLGTEKHTADTIIKNWENKGKDYSLFFSPEKIEVLDALGNNQTTPLDYSKKYHIRLSFTSKNLNSLMTFAFKIYKGQEPFFVIAPEQNYQAKIVKGYNIFDITISAFFLLPGNTYKFVLQSSIQNNDWLINLNNFEIYIDIPVVEAGIDEG